MPHGRRKRHPDTRSILEMRLLRVAILPVILLLFLLLFPGRQKRTLATMSSLGATRGRKFLFVFSGSLALLIPGTIMGAAASMILRDYVTGELMESVGVQIPLVFDSVATTLAVAALQLVMAMGVVALFGLLLAGEGGMAHKRR